MTDITKTEWFKCRPQIIKDLIIQFPQDAQVRIIKTTQFARVHSWNENGTISLVIDPRDNPHVDHAIQDKHYLVYGYEPKHLILIDTDETD